MIVSQTSRGAASWAARRYSAGFSDRRSVKNSSADSIKVCPFNGWKCRAHSCIRRVPGSAYGIAPLAQGATYTTHTASTIYIDMTGGRNQHPPEGGTLSTILPDSFEVLIEEREEQ